MKKLFVMGAMLSMNAMMLQAQTLTLRLDKAETEVSPMLYGLMTEEINWPFCREAFADYLENSFLVVDDEDDD